MEESKISTGELVMLKVDPKFKLDRQFRGPYCVHNVTETCAYVQPINIQVIRVIIATVTLHRTGVEVSSALARPWQD